MSLAQFVLPSARCLRRSVLTVRIQRSMNVATQLLSQEARLATRVRFDATNPDAHALMTRPTREPCANR